MKSKMKKMAALGLTGAMCLGIVSAYGSQPSAQQSESAYTEWLTEELNKAYGEYIDESAKNYKGADLLADEYKESLLAIQPLTDAGYAMSDDHLDAFEIVCNGEPVDPASVEGMTTITCDAPNAKGKMDMYLCRPKDAAEDEMLPCIYLAHGGGYYAGTPLSEKKDCELLANSNHVAVISYDYTLTKEAPYPAALNDAYAGLKYIYENADDQENFEWISESSENEDYREYYKNLPPAIKNAITEKYKDKGIPIRKSALNTFFGYRHLSANDTKKFIENERKAQANIDGLASNFKVAVRNLFYNKYVGYGEALSRYLAHVGKENILIKGISTSWFNIVSNYILLGLNGLSPVQALKYETEGIQQFLQIRDYNEKLKNLNQKKIMSTYTDLDARTEKGIKDALHKLPMYHLYAKGLIGDTLAEDLTESDRFVMNTIDKYISKGPINTLLHNAVMDPQGILYNILSDFASLGDVAGKYALYRYNKEKGMHEDEAVRRSLNSFIDYSNPLPRSLQLLDDLAVMPFMKYALGIQNVIADSLIRHPERSLAWLFASNMIDFSNDIFSSLLGFESLANRLQVPGKLFLDSLETLPSVKLYDALT
jgi:hypothetical protein